MECESGAWKARLSRAAAWVRPALLTAAAGLLAGILALQGWRARADGAELDRRSAALDREIGRMKRENQAMRDELKALETDPVFVESLLRRWKLAAPDERLIE
jgi:hypothetical protein